ncbi:hypothetical protein SAMN00017405_0622 [Desulfonispora thiosulfatigenes DSM 11270]|uniref:Uncharacterized protein n=1 Tax=Desulfonispora thiosulfatigenes DSM 11270 TaxID=656914 RepID=A0A1W1V7T6_DESTI|nr:hypothetical protein [Desulfonispora thiosulfatigenes]SMB89537.1 hypothetical protein SAMN00017405_0622 [Desulfonispora thiosulfatigenes DSM 11270]
MIKERIISNHGFSELANELIILIEARGSSAGCLEILNTLDIDVQSDFILELALMNNPKLITFFNMVVKEKTGEVQEIARRVLRKFALLGHKINEDSTKHLPFDYIQAYISPTRLKGYCTLMFLIKKINGEHDAHYFKLKFNHLGIKGYFHYAGLSRKELISIVEKQGLYPLDVSDAKIILQDAYMQNNRYAKKLPEGYKKYKDLLVLKDYEKEKNKRILFKLQEKLRSYPRVINAYLLALKNLDLSLIYDLATNSLQKTYGERDHFLKNWNHMLQNYTLLKSEILNFTEDGKYRRYEVQIVGTDSEDNLKEIGVEFNIVRLADQHLIEDVQIGEIIDINPEDPLNPLNYPVYTKIYQINDYKKVKEFFQKNNFIHITGELEDQICYKWFKNVDSLETGINFLQHIYGEFILTNQELIVYSNNLQNLSEICCYLKKSINNDCLYFVSKAVCDVRKVYRLMSEKANFNEDKKLTSQESYIIPKEYFAKWHIFCMQNCCKSYSNKNMTTFNFNCENGLIEIIFYGKSGIINLFTNNLAKVSKNFNFPQNKLYKIKDLTTNANISDTWVHLKIIKELNEHKLTKVYKNSCSIKNLATQYNLVQ